MATHGLKYIQVRGSKAFLYLQLFLRKGWLLRVAASVWSPVTSGVPQGSILDSLLFTLFINGRPDEAANGVKAGLYADDTKLYRNVSSTEHCYLIHSLKYTRLVAAQ